MAPKSHTPPTAIGAAAAIQTEAAPTLNLEAFFRALEDVKPERRGHCAALLRDFAQNPCMENGLILSNFLQSAGGAA